MAQNSNMGTILLLAGGAYLAYKYGLFDTLLGTTTTPVTPGTPAPATSTPVTSTPVASTPPSSGQPVCSSSFTPMATALQSAAANDAAYISGSGLMSGFQWDYYAVNSLKVPAVSGWDSSTAGQQMDACTYVGYRAQYEAPRLCRRVAVLRLEDRDISLC